MLKCLLILTTVISAEAFSAKQSASRFGKAFCIRNFNMATSGTAEAVKAVIVRRSGEHITKCFPEDYEELLNVKTDILKSLLAKRINGKELEVFRSPPTSFRMRANFNLWRDVPRNDDPAGMYYAMFEKEDNRQVACEIKSFPRGTVLMNTLMVRFMEVIKDYPSMCTGLFEVRFVTTQSNNAVLTLCYKCPLQSDWQVSAEAAALTLNVKIVGRSRKVKQVAGGDEAIEETYNVRGRALKYYQTEGAFSQPNAKVCEKMLEWALDATADSQDRDLLELYCGGGTFTAALAQNFKKVLATEISKASVELAHRTFKENGVENVKIVRLSSEEFSEAFEEKRIFQRLEDTGIQFKDYDFSTVLVDPPRAGLDSATCELLCRFDKIVYISCNPETLARDVEVMSNTHSVEKVAAFDQFPYTHHLEGGVLLMKRSEPLVNIVGGTDNDKLKVIETATTETETGTEMPQIETDENNNRKRKADNELI